MRQDAEQAIDQVVASLTEMSGMMDQATEEFVRLIKSTTFPECDERKESFDGFVEIGGSIKDVMRTSIHTITFLKMKVREHEETIENLKKESEKKPKHNNGHDFSMN